MFVCYNCVSFYRGIYKGGNRWRVLTGTGGGIVGFTPSICTFVAYVSKTPIKGRVSIPQKNPASLEKILRAYQNILMSVGVSVVANKPVFQNRGIFRNPLSLVEGGYSSISTRLHAFTGKVIKTCINADLVGNEKRYMTVSPLKSMETILMNTIGKDRIVIDKDISRELYVSAGGICERPLLISLEDLAFVHG